MSEVWEQILARAYDYEEALNRQGLKQEDVDRLRLSIEGSEFIPSYILDKQVNIFLQLLIRPSHLNFKF